MNTIDIVCLVIILFFALLGVWRGFIQGVFRLLAWASAIAGAYFANGLLNETLTGFGFSHFSAMIACCCIGFLVPFLGFTFLGHIINKAIEKTVVSKVDRILGGISGMIKACLICFVILSVFHVMPFGDAILDARNNAVSYKIYQMSLESLGYSSEPIDLVDVAEKKASEYTKNIADKASEKASEVVKDAADKATEKATEAAKEAATKAAESAKNSAKEAMDKAADKVAEKIH